MAGTIELDIKVGGLSQLKSDLKSIKDQLATMTPNTPEWTALSDKAGDIQKKINAINSGVKEMSKGSNIDQTTKSFSALQDSLLNLDFSGAAKQSAIFKQSLTSISGSDIIKPFKNLISVVGNLTKAFIQFGLSLLANPIFLIIAGITALVAIIISLLNYFGLLKPILKAISDGFKFIMQVVDATINAFKELTDWLGLTAHAAEDSARRQIEASEAASKAAKEKSEQTIDGMNHEIEIAKIQGKDTVILELQKQKYILQTAKMEQKRLQIRIKEHEYLNDLSAEEMQKMRDSLKEQTKLIGDTYQEIDKIREGNKKKVEENAKKVAENEKKVNEQRNADALKYAEDRRNAFRLSQDLELELMQEGIKKDLKANQIKYQRLIEDTKRNEKLTGEEKKKVIEEYTLLSADSAQAIRKTYADKEAEIERQKNEKLFQQQQEANQKRIALEDAQFALRQELEYKRIEATQGADAANKQKERDALVKAYDDKLLQAGNDLELEKQLREQRGTELDAIEDKYRKIAADKEEADRQAKIKGIEATTSLMADTTKTGLQGISDIVGAFAGKSVSAQKKAFETQKKINIVMATIDMIKGAVSAFSNAQQLGPIAGPIVGALVAASVVASGIANIKKISATKFEGGGSTAPTAPSTGGGGGGGASTGGAAAPSFNLFGQPNQANTMTAAKSVEAKPQTIQAVVVESEVTATQNKVKRMQESATL